jgi:actin related protein 2/3 complex subunit 4
VCAPAQSQARSKTPEALLTPLTISRNDHEQVLIEPSINATRISIKIKQADEIEHVLAAKVGLRAAPRVGVSPSSTDPQFTRFMMLRAEAFVVLRRRAIKGYDISFLITHRNVEDLMKHKCVPPVPGQACAHPHAQACRLCDTVRALLSSTAA